MQILKNNQQVSTTKRALDIFVGVFCRLKLNKFRVLSWASSYPHTCPIRLKPTYFVEEFLSDQHIDWMLEAYFPSNRSVFWLMPSTSWRNSWGIIDQEQNVDWDHNINFFGQDITPPTLKKICKILTGITLLTRFLTPPPPEASSLSDWRMGNGLTCCVTLPCNFFFTQMPCKTYSTKSTFKFWGKDLTKKLYYLVFC